jgi:hypothetical protein
MSVGYVAFFTRHLRYSRTKIVPVWVLYSYSTPKLSNQNTVFHTNEHFTLMSTSTVYFLSQTSIISVIFRFIFWSVYNVTSFNFIVIVLTFRSKKKKQHYHHHLVLLCFYSDGSSTHDLKSFGHSLDPSITRTRSNTCMETEIQLCNKSL